MFGYIINLLQTNCNRYYKKDLYKYLKCVISKDIIDLNETKKIYVIYDNIDSYIKISDIMLNFDYNGYIKYDTYTYKKIRKEIYVNDLFIVNNYIYKNKIGMLNKLIENTIKLIDIYHILKENNDNRINNFNSNLIKQYIINVVDIVNISINQK